jgi:hypothetical protein
MGKYIATLVFSQAMIDGQRRLRLRMVDQRKCLISENYNHRLPPTVLTYPVNSKLTEHLGIPNN